MRVLWLTNDLPPRAGGIEQFVVNLLRRVHPGTTLVLGPAADDEEHPDATEPFEVRRMPVSTVLPTPRTLRRVRHAATEHRAEVIVLGASWPLGELAPHLGRDPGLPVVALTHGLEAGLATVGLGGLVRRATRGLSAVTTISDYTTSKLASHLAAARVERISPGVDVGTFRPGGGSLRRTWGVPPEAVVVGCISRMVRRKGQDVLLDAWPSIRDAHPEAWLVLAGTGPLEERFRRRAEDLRGVSVPGRVPWEDLPRAYGSIDLFAMPCRTRLLGTDVEGLGVVYLEAQACGVPVIVGRSGGAPETVIEGRTGLVVDGRDPDDVAAAVVGLLDRPERLSAMAAEARRHTVDEWAWDGIAERFTALLEEVVDGQRSTDPGQS